MAQGSPAPAGVLGDAGLLDEACKRPSRSRARTENLMVQYCWPAELMTRGQCHQFPAVSCHQPVTFSGEQPAPVEESVSDVSPVSGAPFCTASRKPRQCSG
ncbi:hypothetical protein CEXT_333921 [Caerostris extrusa]|uniref:Uncharacterized protein n=1 Tax=Caerostris extrusa TaxID=172846 RepID=A0AAV4XZN3_CAEEX|nr:hypothetical protein CEXT_333921 [Caerostris extrusa]